MRVGPWVFALAIVSQVSAQPAYRYIMGTSIEVEAFGGTAATRAAAGEEAFAAFAEVDRLMSNYRDDSELALINREAARQPVRISDPMMSVLQAAQKVSAQSAGSFDVTIGPLVRLWGFHDKKPHLPSAEELAVAGGLVNYRNLVLDPAAHTARFTRPGVELDLGGIAKGFAVEIAANVLRRRGLSGFIDAGGNQYLLGTPPGRTRWTVGVKDPDHPDRLLGEITTGETSVSTTADYATFVTINGRKYGHVLDPHTRRPSDAALSVTLLSRDGTMADALSKAVFVLGPTAGLALIESVPGMSGLVAYRKPDGSIGVVTSRRLGSAFVMSVRPALSSARRPSATPSR
jgi:thiamine biosynthesis lipoprotein